MPDFKGGGTVVMYFYPERTPCAIQNVSASPACLVYRGTSSTRLNAVTILLRASSRLASRPQQKKKRYLHVQHPRAERARTTTERVFLDRRRLALWQ